MSAPKELAPEEMIIKTKAICADGAYMQWFCWIPLWGSPQVIPLSVHYLKGDLGIDAEFDDFILTHHGTQVFNIY